MPVTKGTPANGGKPTTAVAPETVGKPAHRCGTSNIRDNSGAGTPPIGGTTEMVRMPATVGTPVTPGIQAELGSLDRRRTARTGCYENDKLMRKKNRKIVRLGQLSTRIRIKAFLLS